MQVVPECPKCRDELAKAALENPEEEEEDVFAVMKPDIVFFGEQLPGEFHELLQDDLSRVSQWWHIAAHYGTQELQVHPAPSHIAPFP